MVQMITNRHSRLYRPFARQKSANEIATMFSHAERTGKGSQLPMGMTVTGGVVRRALWALDRRIQGSNLMLWLAAAIPLLVMYLLTLRTSADRMGIDSVSVTTSAWQLAHHGTPRVPVGGAYYDWLTVPSGPHDIVSNRSPGLIGLAAIFYWLFHSASIFNVAPASVAAAVVTSAAMGTLALVLRRLVSSRMALVAAWIAGTATSTWAVSGLSLWPHSADQLYLAVAMLALASGRYAWAGVAFALGLLTRPPIGVVAAVTGLRASVVHRSVRPALCIGAITGCGLAGYLAYSHEFWGGGLQSGYTATGDGGDFAGNFWDFSPQGIGSFAVNIVGTLVSPSRGVLLRSPFFIVLLFGVVSAWRIAPHWVRSSAVAGLVYMFIQLKSNRFGGGGHFWGYRYPIETLTLLAPLFVLALQTYVAQTARRRATFASLVIVGATIQAIGAFSFGKKFYMSDWMPYNFAWAVRERPVTAAVILALGYLAATTIYRVVSLADDRAVRSSAIRSRLSASHERASRGETTERGADRERVDTRCR